MAGRGLAVMLMAFVLAFVALMLALPFGASGSAQPHPAATLAPGCQHTLLDKLTAPPVRSVTCGGALKAPAEGMMWEQIWDGGSPRFPIYVQVPRP